MKYKLLRFSLLSILTMLWGSVLAEEAKLDFTDASEIQAMGFALPESGKGTDITESFTYNGETMIASASREVDYEGREVDLSIYLNDIPSYTKGTYTVEAYTEDAFLGASELYLR